MIVFSQLVGLSIKGHGIRLHVDAAGLAAAHPANRSTIEGGSAADFMLVHHCRLGLRFGHLRFWQLEFHELVGLFKAAKGHGHPRSKQGDIRSELKTAVSYLNQQNQTARNIPVEALEFAELL